MPASGLRTITLSPITTFRKDQHYTLTTANKKAWLIKCVVYLFLSLYSQSYRYYSIVTIVYYYYYSYHFIGVYECTYTIHISISYIYIIIVVYLCILVEPAFIRICCIVCGTLGLVCSMIFAYFSTHVYISMVLQMHVIFIS